MTRIIRAGFATTLFVASLAAAASADVSHVRIAEFSPGCRLGQGGTAFIELVADSAGQTRDPSLRLEVENAFRSITLSRANLFGAQSGTPWASGTTWLLGSTSFASTTGTLPDGVLPLTLDAFAGAIRLLATNQAGVEYVVDSVRWGLARTGQLRLPYFGQSLVRVAGDAFATQMNPTPTLSSGLAVSGSCFGYVPNENFQIEEVGFVCRAGARAPFVEIAPSAPGLLDPNVTLRLFGAGGTPLGTIRPAFGSHLDRLALPDDRVLLGSSGFESWAGLTPDVNLLFIDAAGGRIELVLPNAAGDSAQVLSSVAYGELPGGVALPPAGGSLVRTPGGTYAAASQATPQGLARLAPPTNCFATPAPAQGSRIRITELGLACTPGTPDVRFVELGAWTAGDSLNDRYVLQILSPTGAVIEEISNLFANHLGRAFAPPARFLVASPAFASVAGFSPDRELLATPDAAGGFVRLLRRRLADRNQLDVMQSVPFGGNLAPNNGGSVVVDPDGSARLETVGTPRNLAGLIAGSPCFGVTRASGGVRITELGASCYPDSSAASFVTLEIIETQARDTRIGIRVFDRTGALAVHVPQVLAPLAQTNLVAGQRVLMGSTRFDQMVGRISDIRLPVEIDRRGARVQVYGADLAGQERALSELVFPSASVPALPPGASIALDEASQQYVVRNAPRPIGLDGLVRTAACLGYAPSRAVRFSEFGVSCRERRAGTGFVELDFTADQFLDPSIGLRLLDAVGDTVFDLPGLYRSLGTTSGRAGQKLLIAGTGFESATGLAPDLRLPFEFGPDGGSCELYQRDYVGQSPQPFARFDYGPSAMRPPRAGESLNLASSPRRYEWLPTPTRLDRSIAREGCYGIRDLAWALSEVGFSCWQRAGNGAWLEVASRSRGARLSPKLSLAMFDANGDTLGTAPGFLGSSERDAPRDSTFVTLASEWLVFENSFDVSVRLPAALDPRGGTVRLYSVENGETTTIDELRYGPSGTVATPPSGSAVHRLPSGEWVVQPPSPTDSSGRRGTLVCAPDSTPDVRIGELGLACFIGQGPANWLELAFTREGGRVPSDVGLRAIGAQGETLFVLPRIMTSVADAAVGRYATYLLATAGLRSDDGAVPDEYLPRAFDPDSGVVILFARSVRGEVELGRLAYGGSSGVPVPRPGQVILRELSGSTYIGTASPKNFAGTTLAGGCFGYSLYVREFGSSCRNGSPGYAYLNVGTNHPQVAIRADIGLRIHDSRGALMLDTPRVLASAAGTTLRANGSALLATTAFASLNDYVPDAVLEQAPDTLGGTLILYAIDSRDSVVELDRVAYGAAAGRPVPLPGGSYRRTQNGFATVFESQPRGLRGSVADGPCVGYVPPTLSIAEVGLECAVGTPNVGFIEIAFSAPTWLDPRVRLRIVDQNGLRFVDDEPIWGALAGQPASIHNRFLISTQAFEAATGLTPDLRVVRGPDADSGSVELYVPLGAGSEHRIARAAYGPNTSLRLPLAGASLANNGSAIQRRATPVNWRAATPTDSACFVTAGPNLALSEVAVGCVFAPFDGSGAFVELVQRDTSEVFPTNVELELSGGVRLQLFSRVAGQRWPLGATWLVADRDFADVNSGLEPDELLPIALSTSVRLVSTNTATGRRYVLETINVRPGTSPPYGGSLEIGLDGTVSVLEQPTPRTSRGITFTHSRCLDATLRPRDPGWSVAELAFGCTTTPDSSAFVVLRAINAPSLIPVGTRLRFETANGTPVSEFGDLFAGGSHPSPIYYWIVAAPGVASTLGFGPDATRDSLFARREGAFVFYWPGRDGAPDSLLERLPIGPGTRGPIAQLGRGWYARSVESRGMGDSIPIPVNSRSGFPNDHTHGCSFSPTYYETCYENNVAAAARVRSLLLTCENGDTSRRLVELSPAYVHYSCVMPPGYSRTYPVFPNQLRIRSMTSTGALIDSVDVSPDPVASNFLLATPAAESLAQIHAVGSAPHMDPTGGFLQTVSFDRQRRPLRVEQTYAYGTAAGRSTPEPGVMLDEFGMPRPPGNVFANTVRNYAHPIKNCGGCGGVGVFSSPPRAMFSSQPDVLLSYGIHYSGPSGLIEAAHPQLVLDGVQVESLADFAVLGVPTGTPLVITAHLDIELAPVTENVAFYYGTVATQLEFSPLGGRSDERQTTQHLTEVVRDTLSFQWQVRGEERFPLRVRVANVRLGFVASAGQYDIIMPPFTARLRFTGLPPGARVVSCHGYGGGFPVPTALALAHAGASPDGVDMMWAGAESGMRYVVERRDAGTQVWNVIAETDADHAGRVAFVDRAVTPGADYDYRLRLGDVTSPETRVHVPVWAFALAPVYPNPNPGDLRISFMLPTRGPGSLALHDIAGRVVARQSLDALEAGRHEVMLARRRELPPGAYMLQLTRPGERRMQQVVLIR